MSRQNRGTQRAKWWEQERWECQSQLPWPSCFPTTSSCAEPCLAPGSEMPAEHIRSTKHLILLSRKLNDLNIILKSKCMRCYTRIHWAHLVLLELQGQLDYRTTLKTFIVFSFHHTTAYARWDGVLGTYLWRKTVSLLSQQLHLLSPLKNLHGEVAHDWNSLWESHPRGSWTELDTAER